MKTIKINFVDFPKNRYFVDRALNALRKRYDVQICDKPDYLFFSCFGNESLSFDGIKIFYSDEDISPDFNLCDYAIAFDDMQFGDRYLRYPNFTIWGSFPQAKEKHRFTQADLDAKTGFCNFICSNGTIADPIRETFFDMLSQYKRVDSGGLYRNNIGGPVPKGVEHKLAFQSRYKFTIAFENGQSDGYTTEKIVDAFAAKTIPIYWGNPSVAKDFNKEAFINCNDYASLEEVVERVKEIDNDDALFRAMLAQPIFTPENDPDRFSDERLEQFLYSIFDQPPESAGRRGHHTRKDYFVWRLREQYDAANQYAQFKKITDNAFFRVFKRLYGFAYGIVRKRKR